MKRALAALAMVGALDVATSASWPPVVTVLTDSMAPAVEAGDAVILARDDLLHVGDVVRVRVPPEGRRLGYPGTIVHRIVDVEPDGTIRTQGDAKTEADPFPVSRHDVDGRVVGTIPAVGRILTAAASPFVLLWLALGAGLAVALPLLEQRWAREALTGLHRPAPQA
jgi:signal peptidase I